MSQTPTPGAHEINFDGLVGPTHNYAGLSYGNVASQQYLGSRSSPRDAALQGLQKMRAVRDLGLIQGVLPPQERPDMGSLRRLGFAGSDAQVLAQAARQAPRLLAACSSASNMWVANAATVSPSADTADHKVHFTPANLANKFHRAIETPTTARVLQATFNDPAHFVHHAALPSVDMFGDEGAANHTRLCGDYGTAGLEIFVYGKAASSAGAGPKSFPARHTREASEAIARLHSLNPARTVLIQQNPAVIDQGVFHNDVIAVGNRNILLFHEQAFLADTGWEAALHNAWTNGPLHLIKVPRAQVSVAQAVQTYLFNSQLVTLAGNQTTLILPQECRESAPVWTYLCELLASDAPIHRLETFDLSQSMRNGGGPACLRLRVVLTETERAAMNPSSLLDDLRFERLCGWVKQHYRDRLDEADLADPALLLESRTALDELTKILALGSIYPFQR
jgi:succinylarginine dihydrolase